MTNHLPKGSEAMNVSAALAVKLGSAIVHADEAMSVDGHAADESAFRAILSDPEVSAWLVAMNENALLPVKRNAGDES